MYFVKGARNSLEQNNMNRKKTGWYNELAE